MPNNLSDLEIIKSVCCAIVIMVIGLVAYAISRTKHKGYSDLPIEKDEHKIYEDDEHSDA